MSNKSDFDGCQYNSATPAVAGPFLFARGASATTVSLAALIVTRAQAGPPALGPLDEDFIAPRKLWQDAGKTVWRFDFSLPAQPSAYYRCGAETLPVNTDFSGDLRIAYVSCNGQEDRDLERAPEIRNALWQDLVHEHDKQPIQLLLHGGDQLYADQVWRCHPEFSAWQKRCRAERNHAPFTAAMARAALDFFLTRYIQVYSQAPMAYLLARVPSLMMWDDHDIFDGWGSHPAEFQQSPVAQGIFQIARTTFCLFQLGAAPAELPAICPVRSGESLSWQADFPNFTILAPDLRSERKRDSVMGQPGWRSLQTMFASLAHGQRVLLLSSVPVIGPRLSLLEKLLRIIPRAQKYEDDLRDQWQSHAHRQEWQRLLELLETQVLTRGQAVTLLSGEIHLATRGVFRLDEHTVHQLVASGIAHSAPPVLFARALGLLARLGENPLPGRPTELRPLPGKRSIYIATRNYLLLQRRAGQWTARWRLEDNGWTPALVI